MNRADLQKLAIERILDARVLLDGKRWPFAYYVTGYAIECALKSCLLARMIHTAWIFEERWDAKVCLTHDFGKLIDLGALRIELNDQLAASAAAAAAAGGPTGGLFVRHWGTVTQWAPSSRYMAKSQKDAQDIFEAVTHNSSGVLPWIQKYW
jgi:hypothetical protein